MARSISLLSLAAVSWPLLLTAQTNPDLARILERLDRLEQENRALSGEVKALRAELSASREGQPAAEGPKATVEERLDIQQARIDELAQTKVEASQKFPVRVTGMALFNAFMNSRQSGGFDYP